MTTRCTGHCCTAFSLPISIEELWENHSSLPEKYPDGDTIVNMLIPKFHVPEKLEASGHGQGDYFYTCRHYKDGQCSIYDRRPSMCANYPYGRGCRYTGCTWSQARWKRYLPVLNNWEKKAASLGVAQSVGETR